MSKTIEFSAEEISELRSFYSNELATAEERIKHIRAILAKIGNASYGKGRKSNNANDGASNIAVPAKKKRGRPALKKQKAVDTINATPKKRGRPAKIKSTETPISATVGGKKRGRKPKIQASPSNATLASPVELNATAPQLKKRGRKPLAAANKKNSNVADKAQIASKTVGAKRGRKPGSKLIKPISNAQTTISLDNNIKAVAEVAGAKRGKKAIKVARTAKSKSAVVSKKQLKAEKEPKLTPAPAKANPEKIKSEATKVKTTAPKVAKSGLTKAKVSKTGPAKVVSAKKVTSKIAKVPTLSASKANKPKIEVAPKKASKKELYQEFIFKTFASEPRFYSTEEIVNAGIKEFKLQGKEKDAAKNTMQFILNGLQSQSKILRRRKEKDRQAYWASIGTNDEGYLK